MNRLLFFLLALPVLLFAKQPFLIICVDAKGLDYSDTQNFFRTLTKHPRDGSKRCDVGHAWIYLEGWKEGRRVYIEGGHSGERGYDEPRYFEGVSLLMEQGDPNPIRYLAHVQKDGFFQWGSGGHRPTFAAGVYLSDEEFLTLLDLIESYHYQSFSLLTRQCTRFVVHLAKALSLDLNDRCTVQLAPFITLGNERVCLYRDPKWQTLTLYTPDILEQSLRQKVKEGVFFDATSFAKKRCRKSPALLLYEFLVDSLRAPSRYLRHKLF